MFRKAELFPNVPFLEGQEDEARARLAAPPSSKRLRVRVSNRARALLPYILVGVPIAAAMALIPASPQDRSAVLPYVVFVYAALLLIIGVYHFTTGYFVLDPARARVVNDGLEIPFEDLRVPRIATETSLGVAGEFGELVQEVQGAVLKCGTHVFFRQGLFRRSVLEKVANALNDAIREYDERKAIRRWLERGGQHDE